MNKIEEQREAYLKLLRLCTKEESNKLILFFFALNDYEGDNLYLTTLNYVMDYLDEEQVHFIMRLGWKATIEDVVWRVEGSLKNNFDKMIELPKVEDYPKRTSISHDNVIQDFQDALNKISLQMGFIDTKSDEYIILLYKIEDKVTVESLVNKIGYNFF